MFHVKQFISTIAADALFERTLLYTYYMNLDLKSPIILDNVFSESDFDFLKNFALSLPKLQNDYNEEWGRYVIKHNLFREYAINNIFDKAKKYFERNDLILTHCVFTEYDLSKGTVNKHKDKNAVEFSFNTILYQSAPWGIWVEDKEYIYYPNQALLFHGDYQEHWRQPSRQTGTLGMLFCAFVTPEHWWKTKGPGYFRVLWKEITEEEYFDNKDFYDRKVFE